MGEHCETCICGRRAPVQASREHGKPSGSVGWAEHLEAWAVYASKYGKSQSAERVAERGGFCFGELYQFLGKAPTTWSPR